MSSSTNLLVSAALLVRKVLDVVATAQEDQKFRLEPSLRWPESTPIFEPEPLEGPVMVMTFDETGPPSSFATGYVASY